MKIKMQPDTEDEHLAFGLSGAFKSNEVPEYVQTVQFNSALKKKKG